jgi:hypothetical protein
MMRLKSVVLLSCLCLLVLPLAGGCKKEQQPLGWPPVKTRDVPAPAPLNMPNVATFTEQTYEIDVVVGQEFAIGIFEGNASDYLRDPKYTESLGNTMILYDSPTPNHYGTQWFIYKALKAGTTEITFNAPLEYYKVFRINIKA